MNSRDVKVNEAGIRALLFEVRSIEDTMELLKEGTVPIVVMPGKVGPEIENELKRYYVEDFGTGYRKFDMTHKHVYDIIVGDDRIIVNRTITGETPSDIVYVANNGAEYSLSEYQKALMPEKEEIIGK